jgi:hypothetical protein
MKIPLIKTVSLVSIFLLITSNVFSQSHTCLVGSYDFNNDLVDNSIFNITGTNNRASYTQDLNNTANSALQLKNNATVLLGNNPRNITNQVSISVWIKTSGNTESQYIAGKYNWKEDAGFHLIVTKEGHPVLAGRSGNNDYISVIDSTSKLNDNKWHQITGVSDGRNWKIYVNGKFKKDTSIVISNPNFASNSNLIVGQAEQTTINGFIYYTGSIDKLRLYNCLLSDNEILNLYNKDKPNCLVGDYQFTGNANDESVKEINGIVNNAVLTTDRFGNSNSAYQFNGKDSYIDLSNDEREITNKITLSAWVSSSQNKTYIVGNYNYNNDGGYHLMISEGKAVFAGRDHSSTYYNAIGTSNIADNNWHFLTGVYNGSTWKIYVNGILEDEVISESQNPSLSSSDILTIGYFPLGSKGNHYYFLGKIDEVKIYNCVLTDQEINDSYFSEITTNTFTKNSELISLFNLYPVPANDFLTIETNHTGIDQYEILDSFGRKIATDKFNSTINIKNLSNGFYILNLSSKDHGLIKTMRFSK